MAATMIHIGITVKDLPATSAWYKRFFNFRLVREFEKPALEIKAAVMEQGTVCLELIQPMSLLETPPPPSGSLPGLLRKQGLNHFAMGVDNCEEVYQQLSESGDYCLTELMDKRFFFCTDPDGTIIEVKQA